MVKFVSPDREPTPEERQTVRQLCTLMILAAVAPRSPAGFYRLIDAPPHWGWPRATEDREDLR